MVVNILVQRSRTERTRMSTSTHRSVGRRAPAGGERPSLAALHPHGRPAAKAGADHRPRRRLLPDRRRRQALPRRARRAVRGADRLLVRRRDRARRRTRRCASCPSTRTGATRIRARSSSPRRSRRSRPATSTASSSSPAAPRPSSPRGSSPASGTPPTASAAGRRSGATSPTTARRWARSRSTASPALRTPFEPLVPEVGHVRNTNRYHRPDGETEEEFTAFLLDDLEHTLDAMRARRPSRW